MPSPPPVVLSAPRQTPPDPSRAWPLVLIPMRGGSKGIPGKNIKPLGGLPLLAYTVRAARAVVPDEHICISTDSSDIAAAALAEGLAVPFMRPPHLATDTASSYDVVRHALDFYEQALRRPPYPALVILQATAPFRRPNDLPDALAAYYGQPGQVAPAIGHVPDLATLPDMVVSVSETDHNPYFALYEDDPDGFLRLSKLPTDGRPPLRRQEAPPVWRYNGSIYVMNPQAIRRYPAMQAFQWVRKYPMPAELSIDLDTPRDWAFADFLLSEGYILRESY